MPLCTYNYAFSELFVGVSLLKQTTMQGARYSFCQLTRLGNILLKDRIIGPIFKPRHPIDGCGEVWFQLFLLFQRGSVL